MITDPVLAFVKVFCLRGDSDGLKQSALEHFDSVSLATAKKTLWDACKSDLEAAELTYHVRQGSEKRSQSAAELDDIVEAFNALDALDKLPTMYCEANDVLKLPPITLDPVSEQLLDNRKSLDNIDK